MRVNLHMKRFYIYNVFIKISNILMKSVYSVNTVLHWQSRCLLQQVIVRAVRHKRRDACNLLAESRVSRDVPDTSHKIN